MIIQQAYIRADAIDMSAPVGTPITYTTTVKAYEQVSDTARRDCGGEWGGLTPEEAQTVIDTYRSGERYV